MFCSLSTVHTTSLLLLLTQSHAVKQTSLMSCLTTY